MAKMTLVLYSGHSPGLHGEVQSECQTQAEEVGGVKDISGSVVLLGDVKAAWYEGGIGVCSHC